MKNSDNQLETTFKKEINTLKNIILQVKNYTKIFKSMESFFKKTNWELEYKSEYNVQN